MPQKQGVLPYKRCVFVLLVGGGTEVPPPNMNNTVHTSNTARKTSCGIPGTLQLLLEFVVILREEQDEFVLYGCHIGDPLLVKETVSNSSI